MKNAYPPLPWLPREKERKGWSEGGRYEVVYGL